MAIPLVKEFDDLAETIANPPANRPIAKAVGNFGRRVCDAISNNPSLYAPTVLQSPILAACDPYYKGAGYDPPVSQPPFAGGQCPVNYRVSGTYLGECGTNLNVLITWNGRFTGNLDIPGPIGAPNIDSNGIWGFSCGNGQRAVCFQGTSSVNSLLQIAPGVRECTQIGTNSVRGAKDVKTTSATRVDGQPDNCGSLPGVFVPGTNPAPNPGPLPPGTGPTFDIRGVPIFVLPPTLEVNPGLDVTLSPGEINLGSGTGGGPAEKPAPATPIAGAGGGTGGGDNNFGEPPPGERWAGCCINVTLTPIGQGIIQSSLPHAIYPATVGNARLKFQGGSGPVTYDTPIVKRQQSTCLWEPVRGLAPVGCFVNLLPGFSYTVIPYSIPLEQ